MLARVERGSSLRTLVAEIGFGRLVEGLVPIATRIREEGVQPDYVPVADGPTLRALFTTELERWRGRFDIEVEVAVDQAAAGWRGRVGVVTTLVPRAEFDAEHTLR